MPQPIFRSFTPWTSGLSAPVLCEFYAQFYHFYPAVIISGRDVRECPYCLLFTLLTSCHLFNIRFSSSKVVDNKIFYLLMLHFISIFLGWIDGQHACLSALKILNQSLVKLDRSKYGPVEDAREQTDIHLLLHAYSTRML